MKKGFLQSDLLCVHSMTQQIFYFEIQDRKRVNSAPGDVLATLSAYSFNPFNLCAPWYMCVLIPTYMEEITGPFTGSLTLPPLLTSYLHSPHPKCL